MKLRFIKKHGQNKLAEFADISQGKRVNIISDIADSIKSSCDEAGYKVKPNADKGFYLIPKFGYLKKLIIKYEPNDAESTSDDVMTVKVFDQNRKEFEIQGIDASKKISLQSEENISKICSAIVESIPSPNTVLEEDYLNEANPFGNMFTRAWDNTKAFFNSKAADKQETKNAKDILNSIDTSMKEFFENALKEKQGDKSYIKVTSKISNDTLEIYLKSSIGSAIQFAPNNTNPDQVIVSKIITPLGAKNVVGNAKANSINDILKLISKQLNIEIIPVEDELNKKTMKNSNVVEEPEEKETSNDSEKTEEETTKEEHDEDIPEVEKEKATVEPDPYNVELLSSLPDEVKKILPESLSLDESKLKLRNKKGILSGDYDKAFDLCKTLPEKQQVIKYFIYQECKLKESDLGANATQIYDQIYDAVTEGNLGFRFNVNNVLAACVRYLLFYKTLPAFYVDAISRSNLKSALANHVDNVTRTIPTKPFGPYSSCCKWNLAIFYCNLLFNSKFTAEELNRFMLYWYSNAASNKALSEYLKSDETKTQFIKIIYPDLSENNIKKLLTKLKSVADLRKILFLDITTKKLFKPKVIKEMLKQLATNNTEELDDDDNIEDAEIEDKVSNWTPDSVQSHLEDADEPIDKKEFLKFVDNLNLDKGQMLKIQKAIAPLLKIK